MGSKARLGDILLEAGEIDAAQLDAALREQEESGRPLGMTLVRMGALREDALVRTLARQLSLPMARLEGKRIAPEVLELVPLELAEKHRCFPLFAREEGDGRSLYLGMEDASDLDAIDRVEAAAGLRVRPVLVAASEIEEALRRSYPAGPEPAPPPDPGTGLDDEPSDPGLDTGPDASALDFVDPGETDDGASESADPDDTGVDSLDGDGDPDLEAFDVGSEAEDPDLFAEEASDDFAAAPEPEAAESPAATSFDDSLGDFGPELELDPPAPEADREEPPEPDPGTGIGPEALPPVPEAARPAPPAPDAGVSRDAILRALTQLLVEKGLIDRDELIARVHRESQGG